SLPFLITSFTLAPDQSYCSMEVSSIEAATYDWDPATEEGTPPPTSGATVPLQIPDPPAGFAVVAAQILVQGSTFGAAAAASWDVPARDTLLHEVQYKLSSTETWASA